MCLECNTGTRYKPTAWLVGRVYTVDYEAHVCICVCVCVCVCVYVCASACVYVCVCALLCILAPNTLPYIEFVVCPDLPTSITYLV